MAITYREGADVAPVSVFTAAIAWQVHPGSDAARRIVTGDDLYRMSTADGWMSDEDYATLATDGLAFLLLPDFDRWADFAAPLLVSTNPDGSLRALCPLCAYDYAHVNPGSHAFYTLNAADGDYGPNDGNPACCDDCGQPLPRQ